MNRAGYDVAIHVMLLQGFIRAYQRVRVFVVLKISVIKEKSADTLYHYSSLIGMIKLRSARLRLAITRYHEQYIVAGP